MITDLGNDYVILKIGCARDSPDLQVQLLDSYYLQSRALALDLARWSPFAFGQCDLGLFRFTFEHSYLFRVLFGG